MKTTIVCLFLFSCLLLIDGFTLTGKFRRRTAAEYREFARQQRGPHLFSKDFLVGYPDETLQTQILIGDFAASAQRTYTVSVEPETDWLYLFDTAVVNQTALTDLNQTFTGRYINYNVTGPRYSVPTLYQSLSKVSDLVNQIFAVVPNFLSSSNEFKIDGVLGLGYSNNAQFGCDPTGTYVPPVQNIMNAIGTEKHYYVLHINATASTSNDHTFDINFGAGNPHCDGEFGYTDLFYAPVADNSFGRFKIDGFKIGDESITSATDDAVIAAGSPIVTVTYQAYAKIIEILNPTYDYAYNLHTAPCANAATYPDFVFQIGGQDYHVPAAQYVVDIGLGNGECMVAFDRTPNTYTTTHWIFGKPFLLTHCMTYDIENKRVGFSLEVQN